MRKAIGSPKSTLLDLDALDARAARGAPGRGRTGRTTGAQLVLVDQEQRGEQLALGVEQVGLRLGRDHVLHGGVQPLADQGRHLRQPFGLAGHFAPPRPFTSRGEGEFGGVDRVFANRTRSSPSSIAAPTVSRLASTRGRAISRRKLPTVTKS